MQTLYRSTLLRVLALVALLAVGLACEGEDTSDIKSDRPAKEKKVDPKKARVVKIRVTEGTGPYSVFVHMSEPGKRGSDQKRTTVAGGPWEMGLKYTSGARVQIKLQVTGNARDTFECEIADGHNRDYDRGRGQVYCEIYTTR